MKKNKIMLLLAVISAIAVMCVFAGCNKGGDSEEKPEDRLVGKWQSEKKPDYVYTFNSDGTGDYNMAGVVAEYNYEVKDGKLIFNFTTDGWTSATRDYVIEGDKLNVKDSYGADTFYNKVKE